MSTPIVRSPIIADRVRRIDGQGFAFVPNRFLRAGFFVSLTRDELALYFLLTLAGDRNGISFYHYDSLCSILELTLEQYIEARNALIRKDLIAFDGTRTQVLSLPAQPIPKASTPLNSPRQLEQHDPATIRSLLLDALDGPSES